MCGKGGRTGRDFFFRAKVGGVRGCQLAMGSISTDKALPCRCEEFQLNIQPICLCVGEGLLCRRKASHSAPELTIKREISSVHQGKPAEGFPSLSPTLFHRSRSGTAGNEPIAVGRGAPSRPLRLHREPEALPSPGKVIFSPVPGGSDPGSTHPRGCRGRSMCRPRGRRRWGTADLIALAFPGHLLSESFTRH